MQDIQVLSLGWEDPLEKEMTSHSSILPLVVVGGLVAKLCPTLETPWIIDHEDPLSIRFPRHKYWSGLSFPSLADLPNSGIESTSATSLPFTVWVTREAHDMFLFFTISFVEMALKIPEGSTDVQTRVPGLLT